MKRFAGELIIILMLSCVLISNHNGWRVSAKKYLRCELARELLEQQISKTFLSNWICLVEHESQGDTSKLTILPNGLTKYGLFQISSKECRQDTNFRPCDSQIYPCCNYFCADFIDDNIADDVDCAKRLFDQRGLQYWPGWSAFCRNPINLPNLSVSCNMRDFRKKSLTALFRYPNKWEAEFP